MKDTKSTEDETFEIRQMTEKSNIEKNNLKPVENKIEEENIQEKDNDLNKTLKVNQLFFIILFKLIFILSLILGLF